MCQSLSELRQAWTAWASGFEPERLSATDAARVIADASAVEASARTVMALAAARAGDCSEWQQGGYRSPAEALARKTGMPTGAATELIDSAKQIARHDQLRRAALAGDISGPQAQLIAKAAQADPASVPDLIANAPQLSHKELRGEVARIRARRIDREIRRRQIHRHRAFRQWTDEEGVWRCAGQGNPEDGAVIMAALAPIQDEILARHREADQRAGYDAYAFDALVQMAREAMSEPGPAADAPLSPEPADAPPTGDPPSTWDLADCAGDPPRPPPGPPPGPAPGPAPPVGRRRRRRRMVARSKVLVRVDFEALLRGYPVGDEVCDIPGYGPVSVEAVKDILATRDPFLVGLIGKAKDVRGVAHFGRAPSAHQKSALQWIFPECTVLGCPGLVEEYDHRHDWAETHHTVVDELDGLCRRCHWLKTHLGWGLVPGAGKRPLVPPDDTRHPHRDPPQPAQTEP